MRQDMNNMMNQNGIIRGAYDTNKYFRNFLDKLNEDDSLVYNEDLILRCHYVAGLFDGISGLDKINIDHLIDALIPKKNNRVMYTTSTVSVDSIINHRSKVVKQAHCELYDKLFNKAFEAWNTDKTKFPCRDYMDTWIWNKYGIFVNTDNSTYNTETNQTAPFGETERHLKIINLASVETWQEEYLANGNELYTLVFNYAKLVVDDFISKYDIWFDDPDIMITRHGAAIQNAVRNTFGIDCDLVISGDDSTSYMHITTIAPYRSLAPYESTKEEQKDG